MGWTSTGDPYQSVGEAALKFDSKESAVEFAEKYGWQYTVSDIHFALCYDETPLLMMDEVQYIAEGPIKKCD